MTLSFNLSVITSTSDDPYVFLIYLTHCTESITSNVNLNSRRASYGESFTVTVPAGLSDLCTSADAWHPPR